MVLASRSHQLKRDSCSICCDQRLSPSPFCLLHSLPLDSSFFRNISSSVTRITSQLLLQTHSANQLQVLLICRYFLWVGFLWFFRLLVSSLSWGGKRRLECGLTGAEGVLIEKVDTMSEKLGQTPGAASQTFSLWLVCEPGVKTALKGSTPFPAWVGSSTQYSWLEANTSGALSNTLFSFHRCLLLPLSWIGQAAKGVHLEERFRALSRVALSPKEVVGGSAGLCAISWSRLCYCHFNLPVGWFCYDKCYVWGVNGFEMF